MPILPLAPDLISSPPAAALGRQNVATPQSNPIYAEPDTLIRQPEYFRQPQATVRKQRAAWCQPPAPTSSGYLVIGGARVAVPFPTVCFDEDIRLATDSTLPMRPWLSNLFATGFSALKTATSWTALKSIEPRKLVEPDRLYALWAQGNMQLCATTRQDQTGAGVDTLVLHWDGCNSSAQMYGVLRRLGLSAHLLIDSDATVYQMADLAKTKAFHAGWINERSIGIEFNNPIDPSVDGAARLGRVTVDELLPHHNRRIARLDYTPLQKERLCQLADVLQTHFDIGRVLPPSIDAQGIEQAPGLMPSDFRGVCGHYHVGAHKIDPGLSFWPVLRAHWRQAGRVT